MTNNNKRNKYTREHQMNGNGNGREGEKIKMAKCDHNESEYIE